MTALLSAVAFATAVLLIWPVSVTPARLRRIARGSVSGDRASAARGGAASGPRLRTIRGAGGSSRRGRPAGRPLVPVPTVLDLVAEVVAAGAPAARGLLVVAECVEPVDGLVAAELFSLAASVATGPPAAPPTAQAGADPMRHFRALAAAVDLSVTTGAGPVGLIRAAAQEERRRGHAAQVQAARRAGVTVLLPTGLCLLPAFVLLTVAPLVIELMIG